MFWVGSKKVLSNDLNEGTAKQTIKQMAKNDLFVATP